MVITTEGHTASLDLTTDGIELLPGELAYTTKAVSGWTALAAAPTLEWVDNPTFEPQEIKAGMSVKVNLQAAALVSKDLLSRSTQKDWPPFSDKCKCP